VLLTVEKSVLVGVLDATDVVAIALTVVLCSTDTRKNKKSILLPTAGELLG